jgi:hypothetical protein
VDRDYHKDQAGCECKAPDQCDSAARTGKTSRSDGQRTEYADREPELADLAGGAVTEACENDQRIHFFLRWSGVS